MKLLTEITEEYKNLLEMLTSINEQITTEPRETDLAAFADKHKTLLKKLREQSELLAQDTRLQQEHPEEYSTFIKEITRLIAAIQQEEQKLIPLLQKDYQHVKEELSRMQTLKRANPQYNMQAQREAVFIDKRK